jgi:oxygen-dependent protoporphyrinogen oxidase
MRRQVIVIGGGVSGLATAYHLLHPADGIPPRVSVLEAEPRLGGKVATEPVAGTPADTGPDALLVRLPAVTDLLRELGLEDLLRPPASTGAFVWSRGRLRPLPAGSLFGVPDRIWPLLRSGLLSPVGALRAGGDLVLPRRLHAGAPTGDPTPRSPTPRDPTPRDLTTQDLTTQDPTIEQLLRPRFGTEVYQRLVEPLLGGIHAGSAARLSARSAVPELAELAAGHRSLYLALRRRGPRAGGPALMTLQGGLGRLVQALRDAVEAAPGGRVLTGERARAVSRGQSGWTVLTGEPAVLTGEPAVLTGEPAAGQRQRSADDVVLTAPAWECARLLAGSLPPGPGTELVAALRGIPYVGVATVTLAYHRPVTAHPLIGTGFLVPPREGRLLVGCTWLSQKWPHLAEAPHALVRCLVGRDGDQRWAELDDAALVTAVRGELAEAMGLRADPLAALVRRLPGAMPQYTVGHAGRLAAIDAALSRLPGLYLTGAAYRGIGIASCLTQAKATASAVAARSDALVAP